MGVSFNGGRGCFVVWARVGGGNCGVLGGEVRYWVGKWGKERSGVGCGRVVVMRQSWGRGEGILGGGDGR